MRLLIVDDEMQIRTGLEQGINWEEQGFDEVYTAKNGIEALELCNELQPELIITDIHMPGMDGIELSSQVVNSYEFVEIIILSGYSEFEYAREALKLGAFDYLLKPINIEELLKQVNLAKESLKKKKDNQQMHSAYKKLSKENIWMQYLNGQDDSSQAEIYLNGISKRDIIVVVFSIDNIWKGNFSQLMLYLNQHIQTTMKKYQGEILFSSLSDIICFINIFSVHEYERKVERLQQDVKELNKKLGNQFKNTISVGLSPVDKGKNIVKQYEVCQEILRHRMYLGQACLLQSDLAMTARQIPLNPIQPSELKAYIGRFDYEGVRKYLVHKFLELQKQQITSTDFVKGICLELKNILLSTILEKGIDVESIFEYNQFILNDIPDYRTLDEFLEWVCNLYFLILSGLSQLLGRNHSRVIVQSVDYIAQNYASNISLDDMAEYVNKSKNYFSYLFKKEMEISFVEYLNQVRIEQAKRLLLSTDDLTYEISEKVGYSDYKYFSSVFKKQVGVSPAQFKKSK